MIFPTSSLGNLILLVVALFFIGSWASTYKFTFKWRFELFHYDVTWGVLLTAVIAAFTLGSLNEQELTFSDNFLLAGYRKMAWAMAAGCVFNLSTVMVLASMVTSRMSVAFPLSFGLGLIVSSVVAFAPGSSSAVLLFGGCGVLVVAILIHIFAFRWHVEDQEVAVQKAFLADPRSKAAPKRASPLVGILLGTVSGLLLGAFSPMLNESISGENGTSPYGAILLVASGMFLSSILIVPFFMNFPVTGEPIQVRHYFKGTAKSHLLGILGGVMLCASLLGTMVAAGAPASARVGPVLTYILGGSGAVVASLWGVFVWREFKGATNRAQMAVVGGIVLFLAGVTMIGFSKVV